MRFLTSFGLLLLVSLRLGTTNGERVEVPSEEEWLSCRDLKVMASLPNCLCHLTPDGNFRVNCDHVVFAQDFPYLPFRQPITHFSQRFANYQNIPPQGFIASGIPLKYLDLSHNWLRRLTEKAFEGLAETLEILDLGHNLLGDQLNPIFSTNEFKKLPRLRILRLGNNSIFDIDDGILDGCLSMQEFYLDSNKLKRVPTSSFKGPNSLKVIDLNSNEIDQLKMEDFKTQKGLLMINLNNNKISAIEGNSFRGLTSLKILDLSYNRLNRLNSDSFIGLSSLEHFNLASNFLSEIPIVALKSLGTIRTLSLSSNLIQNLGGSNLKHFTMLEVLDLSRNRINDIPRGFFQGMRKLKELNLGINQLRTIPANIFEDLPSLQALNLMDNNLLGFPSAALDPLNSLLSLNLDYNRISALTPIKILNLTELSLSHNLIREIPSDVFSNFPKLQELNLRGNLIENLEEVELPKELQMLNLGMNHLKTIPRFPLDKLEELRVDGNQLSSLLQHNFVLLKNLKDLDLSSNSISTIFMNTFDGLDNLEILNMASNNLENLPKLNGMANVQLMNFSKNSIKEINAIENLDYLQILDLSFNQIANLKPDIFINSSFLSELNLENNKLTSFKGFTGAFTSLNTLNLQGNQISYVYPNSFENFGNLWNLEMSGNRFTMFPTEFLRNCKQLRYIGLSKNQIKNLQEMNFSNFPHLRILDLSENLIEFVNQNTFLNSSQLQRLNLASNKLENIDGTIFHGIIRLELDISNNYLSSLPSNLFERNHVQKLQKINLSKNAFSSIPSEALQKQYFHLDTLDLSENKIKEIVPNLNILVNVKTLDLSYNPLNEESIKNLLNEPKTVRDLNLANCSITSLPLLEMPFLRKLNLSNNQIKGFESNIFNRTSLLESISLASNEIYTLDSPFPSSLKQLDLSKNPLTNINGNNLPQSLESLKLNDLINLLRVDKASVNLKNLVTLELYDLPKLGYLDIKGILTNLQYLENFDFEVKDNQIVDQIHSRLNSRTKNIGLRGKRIRSISTGAFAGLTAQNVQISLTNTSLSVLPSILVPVPMSSNIVLDITGSKINNLSPPFLSQNIKIQGVSPFCDCNSVHFVKYLKTIESNIVCSGPPKLAGISVLNISLEDLICESGVKSTTTPKPATFRTTTTSTTLDDIIWSLPPATSPKPSKKASEKTGATKMKTAEITKMDHLIIGIVAGVVGLILLFIFIIICFVRMSSDSSTPDYPAAAASVISVPAGYAASGKCTCPHKGPGPGGMYVPSNYATVRSGKSMHNGSSYPPSYREGGGSIYAIQGGPYNNMPMNQGPYGVYGNTLRQQQQIYGSIPYFVHDEYERR